MTDREAARKYASDLTGQGTAYAMFADDLDDTLEETFLAGIKYARKRLLKEIEKELLCYTVPVAPGESRRISIMVETLESLMAIWEK